MSHLSPRDVRTLIVVLRRAQDAGVFQKDPDLCRELCDKLVAMDATRLRTVVTSCMDDRAGRLIAPVEFKGLNDEQVHRIKFLVEHAPGMVHIDLGEER